MLVPTGAMHVTVGELFGSRVADVDDLDVEVERRAGERVIGVDGDVVALHVDDGDDGRAVLSLRLELHAGANVLNPGEGAARHLLNQPLVFLSIRGFGRDG